jgi:hypothetical protein
MGDGKKMIIPGGSGFLGGILAPWFVERGWTVVVLSRRESVPGHVELGNEFWVAMGRDPDVLRHWPDEPTSMRVMQRYLTAFRAYLPKGAKVAVQATVPLFYGESSSHGPMIERLRRWNDNLQAEPWFDAVTIHLYPRLNEVVGRGAAEDPISPHVPCGKRRLSSRAGRGGATLAECRGERRGHLPTTRGSRPVPRQGPRDPDSPERLGRCPRFSHDRTKYAGIASTLPPDA